VEVGENVELTATISSGARGDAYTWSSDDEREWDPDPVTEGNTILSYILTNEGIVTFYVKTKVGACDLDADTVIEVIEPIPNILTPYDGNDKNNVFMGPKGDRAGYELEIYNRYQQLVFRGKNGWDGTYRGKPAEPGTYFYRIQMKSGKVFKGTVEVAKF
jgi:gliding motility-associated-like protein